MTLLIALGLKSSFICVSDVRHFSIHDVKRLLAYLSLFHK